MKTIHNFIDPDFIHAILKENSELMYENVWKSNLGWQNEIVAPTGVVLIRSLSDIQSHTIQEALYASGLAQKGQIEDFEAQVYLWHKLSFIPWHNDKYEDDKVRFAASLYLNPEWNEDWGGLFLYKFENQILAESPIFNKLVFNDHNYAHSTSILSVDAPLRQSIQLFWKNKE